MPVIVSAALGSGAGAKVCLCGATHYKREDSKQRCFPTILPLYFLLVPLQYDIRELGLQLVPKRSLMKGEMDLSGSRAQSGTAQKSSSF